jgi:hypothetical protein
MGKISRKVFVLALLLINVGCTLAKSAKIEYLLPAGFTGGVIVLYNQPDGVAPETLDDGTIRYRIPKDGFLMLNTQEPENIINYSFYYVDDKNNTTRIEYIAPQGSTAGERGGLRSVDTITEEERNSKVFAMNHRGIGFEENGNKGPLNAFSIGLPKDSRSIYLKTLDKYDEIRERFSKKRP